MKMPFDKEKISFTKSERIFIGVCLIFWGVTTFGFHKGWVSDEWEKILYSVPMLILAVGIYLYYCRRYIISGVVLMLFGGYFPFLMKSEIEMDNTFVNLFKEYWPVLFVLIGFYVLLRCNKKLRKTSEQEALDIEQEVLNNQKKGIIKDSFILSEGDHIFLEPEFKGGEMVVYLGNARLDLRHTTIQGTVDLRIKVTLGNMTIQVPSDWSVEICKKSLFCAYRDRRSQSLSDGKNILRIKANSLLSEIEIK